MQLPDTVTLTQATELLQQVQDTVAASASGTLLRIDASAVTVLDTAAVALLLEARRLAEQRGLGFEIAGAPPKLAELAVLYGVAGLLSLSAPSASAPLRAEAT